MNSGQFIENCAGSGQPSTSTQALHIVNDAQVVLGKSLKSASETAMGISSPEQNIVLVRTIYVPRLRWFFEVPEEAIRRSVR